MNTLMLLSMTCVATPVVYDIPYPRSLTSSVGTIKAIIGEYIATGGNLPPDIYRPDIRVEVIALPRPRYYKLTVTSRRTTNRLRSFKKTIELWVLNEGKVIRVRSSIRIVPNLPQFRCGLINRIVRRIAGRVVGKIEGAILKAERRLLERIVEK